MQIAKWIVALVAVWNFGGFVVDALIPVTAKQHLYNPRWPAHAKFHNCQTMVIGIILGLASLWLLFGMGPLTIPHLLMAAVVAGAYFVSMLFADVSRYCLARSGICALGSDATWITVTEVCGNRYLRSASRSLLVGLDLALRAGLQGKSTTLRRRLLVICLPILLYFTMCQDDGPPGSNRQVTALKSVMLDEAAAIFLMGLCPKPRDLTL